MAKFLKRYNTQEEYDQDLPNLNKEWMIGYVKEGKKVNYLNNPYYGAVVLKYRFTEDFTSENAFFNLIPETESVLINGVSYDPNEISSRSWSAGEYEVKFYPKSDSETINSLNCDGNERLVEVHIDDNCGITGIQDNAFRGCSQLEKVHLSNKITEIGSSAFDGCGGLIEIVIPDSVTSIDEDAFSSCRSLTEIVIPNSVKSIGDHAFFNCDSLTSVTIGNSVISISYNAFWWCRGLSSIKVSENNTVYDSRENCNAIIETTSNKLIYGCKNTIIPDSVTSIDDYAFKSCSNLTKIVIPDSVISIGYSAFQDCTSLTEIVIPNSVTSIDDYTFQACYNLTEIVIPSSVTSIGNGAFSRCHKLASITCNAITAPSIRYGTFVSIDINGILYYPQGSDYSSWMLTDKYYLGYYNWTSQEI